MEKLFIKQVHEMAELFGFETRNKYQIKNSQGEMLFYACEEKKGWLGFLFRQFLGHWRTFTIHFYDMEKREFLRAHHPFRFFFKRLEVSTSAGVKLGAMEQRWAIINKKFDVEDAQGRVIMTVRSPFWRLWSFPFYGTGQRHGQQLALIAKKWSGIFSEMLTDKDNFLLEYAPTLEEKERHLLLAAAVYIDLIYFENHAGRKGV